VAAFDSRAPQALSWWDMDADVESLLWDTHSPSHFFVATEAGTVRYYDIRNSAAPVYTLVAHDESVSAMDQHPTVAGLLVTGSADETVKVWDVRDNKPSMVISRNLDVGSVFAARFCPDEPMLMAVGGSNGESRIWDMSTNADVRATFGDATARTVPVAEKPLVGLQKDDDVDDDEDDNQDAVIAEMHGEVMQPMEAKPSDDDEDEDEDEDDEEEDEDAAMASDSE
ncbi:rRNA-processing protein, partial [Coemansia furcata]